MNIANRARLLLAVGLGCVVWVGCRDDNPVGEDKNLEPETYLVQSPQYNDAGYYINHLYWDGFDLDGRITFYEVTIADSAGNLDDAVWRATYRSDSLVRFEVGGDNGTAQLLHNRFYVRAVDNLGRRDLSPAWILFKAKDFNPPEVVFTEDFGFVPGDELIYQMQEPASCDAGFPPDTLPNGASVRFRWFGVDRDSLLGTQVGTVDAFEYKLTTVNNTFIGGSIADTVAEYASLSPGTYSFIVRPFDDGGLVGQGCRYFHVNFDPRAQICRIDTLSAEEACGFIEDCQADPAIGDNPKFFRVSDRQLAPSTDTCEPLSESDFLPWDSSSLPDPPAHAFLPAGTQIEGDELPIRTAGSGWFLELDTSTCEQDGFVVSLEIMRMNCAVSSFRAWPEPDEPDMLPEPICTPRTWECAARIEGDENGTVYFGPLGSGDHQIVIAAVDDVGQRGSAYADTIQVSVDLRPILELDRPGIKPRGCDRFYGFRDDTVKICGVDDVLIVETTQEPTTTPTEAPCAITIRNETTGLPQDFNLYDYASFPASGDTVQVAFELDPIFGTETAEISCLMWARDLDGTGRVSRARWAVDRAPSATDPFERVYNDQTPTEDPTPMCFVVTMEQLEPTEQYETHILYVEVMDWFAQDVAGAAQRTRRYTIPFYAEDISKKRYTLPGRN